MTFKKIFFLIFIFSFFYINFAKTECLSDKKVLEIINNSPHTPIEGISGNITLDDAYCSQNKFIKVLKKKLGKPIGYKVGFTGKSTQEKFKITTPATGVLFKTMFIENGGSINKNFGHRTLIEPDLMVIVKDSRIMEAKSELEAAKYLDTIHPFMELPALQIKKGEPITGAVIVAINMVATKMVMGPGIPIQANQEFIDAMGTMETIFTDENNEVIQNSPGSTLLGNPMKVVLWLVKEMNNRGVTLESGDRLSLGSVGKLFPLKESNKTYTYSLIGLPGGPSSAYVHIK